LICFLANEWESILPIYEPEVSDSTQLVPSTSSYPSGHAHKGIDLSESLQVKQISSSSQVSQPSKH